MPVLEQPAQPASEAQCDPDKYYNYMIVYRRYDTSSNSGTLLLAPLSGSRRSFNFAQPEYSVF